MSYNERHWNIFNHDDPFSNNDHPRRLPIHPKMLEEMKANAINNRLEAEQVEMMTREIEFNLSNINQLERNLDWMVDDNNLLNSKLRAFKKKFWEINKCKAENCRNWYIRNTRWSDYTCKTCDWTWFIFKKQKEEFIYIAVDKASEESKDNTCIVTFKKNEDWLEIIDTKIIKPKKK